MADTWLRQKAPVESVATEHADISYFLATMVDNVWDKEQQHLVLKELWAGMAEVRAWRMVGMG